MCVWCVFETVETTGLVRPLVPGRGGEGGGDSLLFGMCLKSDADNRVDLFRLFLIAGGQPLAI